MGAKPLVRARNVRSPRRVVHLITGLGVGGAELSLLKLLQRLDRRCFEPAVIGLLGRGRVGDEIANLDVPVYPLGWRRGLPGPLAFTRLVALCRQLAPDLLQGWMYHGNLAAWAVHGMLRQRCTLSWNIRHTVYDLADEKPLTRNVIRLGARLSRRPAAIIYNAAVSAERHETLGYCAARRHVLPNGFDTDLYRPDLEAGRRLRGELGVSETSPLIGSVGRWHHHKGQDLLCRAAARVRKQQPTAEFVLAGRELEPGNQELQRLLAELDLEHCCHLLGERRDVPAILAGLDLLVSPSRIEAFPNVIGEAMATGTGVVATDVGDTGRLLGDCGEVVPPEDPAALAVAIERWLAQSEQARRATGRAARRRIVTHYGIDAMADRYSALYQGLIWGGESCALGVAAGEEDGS